MNIYFHVGQTERRFSLLVDQYIVASEYNTNKVRLNGHVPVLLIVRFGL